MPVFGPVTRISGTLRTSSRFRHGTGRMFGTLRHTATFRGAARKNGVADVRGTIRATTTFSGTTTSYLSFIGQGNASLLPLRSIGANYLYSEGRPSFEPLESLGNAGLPEGAYAIGEAILPLLSSAGIGLTGGLGQGDVSLRPLGSIGANYPYSAGIVAFEPLTSFGVDKLFSPDIIMSRAQARARYHIAAPASRIEISSQGLAVRRLHVEAGSSLVLTSAALARGRYHLIAPSSGIVVSDAYYRGTPLDVWAFTLPNINTGAGGGEAAPASRYESFEFNSFAMVEERYYAVGDSGISEIGGENDDAAEIAGDILTGTRPQGADRLQRMPIVYLTGRSEGLLHCAVIDEDGAVHDYTAERACGPRETRQRVKIGCGLKASLWQLRIGNEGGQDFELMDAGSLPDVLKRRIG